MSFRELQKPQPETAGPDIGKWFVYATFDAAVDIDVYALLADGTLQLDTVDIGDDGDPFYFVDELSAYRGAHDYYNAHGLVYPRMDRLIELELKYGIGNTTGTGSVESEVMEF